MRSRIGESRDCRSRDLGIIKTVNSAVVGVKILEHWQQLKVYGMPFESYLGEGKIELLKQKMELSTGIKLKTLPYWLISEDQLSQT